MASQLHSSAAHPLRLFQAEQSNLAVRVLQSCLACLPLHHLLSDQSVKAAVVETLPAQLRQVLCLDHWLYLPLMVVMWQAVPLAQAEQYNVAVRGCLRCLPLHYLQHQSVEPAVTGLLAAHVMLMPCVDDGLKVVLTVMMLQAVPLAQVEQRHTAVVGCLPCLPLHHCLLIPAVAELLPAQVKQAPCPSH